MIVPVVLLPGATTTMPQAPAAPAAPAVPLFAESMMDLRPWKFWNADGSPAPGTLDIVATLAGL